MYTKDAPEDDFFDLYCPKLKKLLLNYDPESFKKFRKFTKHNPTITELFVDGGSIYPNIPLVEFPVLLDVISPLYQRLATLRLEAIAKLPSLSFLLEKLPNLVTLDLNYCVLDDISDIFTSNGYYKIKTLHNPIGLSLDKWFAPKCQLDQITTENLVFNTNLLPNIKSMAFKSFLADSIPTTPPPSIHGNSMEFGIIPQSLFFNSGKHHSITELDFFAPIAEKGLIGVARSCPNVEKLRISLSVHSIAYGQFDITNELELIATTLFPKLIKLNIELRDEERPPSINAFGPGGFQQMQINNTGINYQYQPQQQGSKIEMYNCNNGSDQKSFGMLTHFYLDSSILRHNNGGFNMTGQFTELVKLFPALKTFMYYEIFSGDIDYNE
ncbi:hypothetical protein H4219_002638 [Mycoemilia scoparia]|uniref:Uncharacterized protein n=1 Tax=Mycoemilia scoparia TaxID=417184 RepID=A0A9W8DUJ0_9FUNG|nr:hypothetical protein H4219_002638 [Mycoemilia scoparia]